MEMEPVTVEEGDAVRVAVTVAVRKEKGERVEAGVTAADVVPLAEMLRVGVDAVLVLTVGAKGESVKDREREGEASGVRLASLGEVVALSGVTVGVALCVALGRGEALMLELPEGVLLGCEEAAGVDVSVCCADCVWEGVGGLVAAEEGVACGGFDTEWEPSCVPLDTPGKDGQVEGWEVRVGVAGEVPLGHLGEPVLPNAERVASPRPPVGEGAAGVGVGAADMPVRVSVGRLGVPVGEGAAGEGVALKVTLALALHSRTREEVGVAVAGRALGVAMAAGERVSPSVRVEASVPDEVPVGLGAVGLDESVAPPALPVGCAEKSDEKVASWERVVLRVPRASDTVETREAWLLPVRATTVPVGRSCVPVALPVASKEYRALREARALRVAMSDPTEETLARALSLLGGEGEVHLDGLRVAAWLHVAQAEALPTGPAAERLGSPLATPVALPPLPK